MLGLQVVSLGSQTHPFRLFFSFLRIRVQEAVLWVNHALARGTPAIFVIFVVSRGSSSKALVLLVRMQIRHFSPLSSKTPPWSPFLCFFRFLCFFGVVSTLAFFVVQRAFGGSKKRSFDEKSAGRNSQTGERSLFWAKKAQKRAKQQRNCAFFG